MFSWNRPSKTPKASSAKLKKNIGLQEIQGCDNSERSGDVIFVHGLGGNFRSTWHPEELQDNNFWLNWLHQAHADIGIWSFGYEAEPFEWRGKAIPLFDQASNLLEWLEVKNLSERPLIFVTHSLGGLLVKKMLNTAQTFKKQKLIEQIKGIVFLATPHTGSHLANLINNIGSLARTTVSVEELKAHTPQLRELNEWYRENVRSMQISTKVYYETRPVYGVLVVAEDSANPGIEGVKPVAVPEDHITIAKPDSTNNLIYIGVERFIVNTFNASNDTCKSDISLEKIAWNKLENLYFESFDADDIGDDLWSFFDDEVWTYEVSNGVYKLRNETNPKNAKYVHVGVTSPLNNSDIDISESPVSVEIKPLATDDDNFSGGGLIYRFNSDSRRYYAFILFSDGRFGFYRKDKDSYFVLYSARIGTTQFKQFHKLGIAAKGDVFYLYIDDYFTKAVRDSELAKGRVGIIAWGTGEYLFDNFHIV